jgi:hypothetical protein
MKVGGTKTRTEVFLGLLVILTLIVTGAVAGYTRGFHKGADDIPISVTASHHGRESYAVPKQIPVLCFHGIGTPSSRPGAVDYYNTTPDNFRAEMAYLAAHGYSTITPQQYANWQHGVRQLLPAKPILLTFDDAFTSDAAATQVLNHYGFRAVMFVVTGYANGDFGSRWADWRQIRIMAREGWMIQLHAGECGHAYMPDAPGSCTAGLSSSQITSGDFQYYIWRFGQSSAQYQARVVNDITVGQQAIQENLGLPPGWQSAVFAAPFGAWGNGQDAWLISYWDHTFSTVFVQHISAQNQAAAHADGVRYRLELGYGAQSAAYLASQLSNPAFTLAGAGSGVSTGSPNAGEASG